MSYKSDTCSRFFLPECPLITVRSRTSCSSSALKRLLTVVRGHFGRKTRTVSSTYRLYTKMLRLHLFNIITIKTTRALDALVPIGLLLVKTLTTVLTYRLSRSNIWNGKQSIHIWYTYKVVLAMVVHVYV